jgi:hypothetical protein
MQDQVKTSYMFGAIKTHVTTFILPLALALVGLIFEFQSMCNRSKTNYVFDCLSVFGSISNEQFVDATLTD